MFQPNYPKAALGLEKEFITALALQKEGRDQFGIRQAATIELPVGLINPSFTEKNISSQREMLARKKVRESVKTTSAPASEAQYEMITPVQGPNV